MAAAFTEAPPVIAPLGGARRVDTASRVIAASPDAVFSAFVDPQAFVSWLPPQGMNAALSAFEPRNGGSFRITLTYEAPDPGVRGKTSDATDVVEGRFVELVPGVRMVLAVGFDSDDPAFAGEMTMTWALEPVADGTRVTIRCENVPDGISPQDHAVGLNSTLENLAAYLG